MTVWSYDYRTCTVSFKQYYFWQNFFWESRNNVRLNRCRTRIWEASGASAQDGAFLLALRFVSDAVAISEEGVMPRRLPNWAPLNESLMQAACCGCWFSDLPLPRCHVFSMKYRLCNASSPFSVSLHVPEGDYLCLISSLVVLHRPFPLQLFLQDIYRCRIKGWNGYLYRLSQAHLTAKDTAFGVFTWTSCKISSRVEYLFLVSGGPARFLHMSPFCVRQSWTYRKMQQEQRAECWGWNTSVAFLLTVLESSESVLAISLSLWRFAITLQSQPSRDRKCPCAAQNYSWEHTHSRRQIVTWRGCLSAGVT